MDNNLYQQVQDLTNRLQKVESQSLSYQNNTNAGQIRDLIFEDPDFQKALTQVVPAGTGTAVVPVYGTGFVQITFKGKPYKLMLYPL